MMYIFIIAKKCQTTNNQLFIFIMMCVYELPRKFNKALHSSYTEKEIYYFKNIVDILSNNELLDPSVVFLVLHYIHLLEY